MLTALSAACADSAMVILHGTPHPLNLWTMLVGASTTDRKTTATKLAVDRLEQIDSTARRIQRIFGSPEGFLEALAEEPCSLLYISEGAAFFEQREASYWRHAKGMFMDLYDYTPMFRRRLAKREIEIENPRLSILSACAQPLLDHHSKMTDWLGGFLPRFLMIMGEKTEFRPSLRTNRVAEKQIEDQIFKVWNHNWGPISVSSAAQHTLESFSYEINAEMEAFPQNLHPALNRLPESTIRLSALYEIAQFSADPPNGIVMVSNTSAQHAVALCRASRDAALMPLAELTEGRTVARELTRIETVIRQMGLAGLSRTKILRNAHIHARQLDEILTTLTERESVYTRHDQKTSKNGRPKTVYVHVEAKSDAVRAATNIAIDPEPGAVWISLDGEHPDRIDGLAPSAVDENGDPLPEPDDDPERWN